MTDYSAYLICGLFHNAVNSSDYIASDDMKINEFPFFAPYCGVIIYKGTQIPSHTIYLYY
jgi:hypothetical protein